MTSDEIKKLNNYTITINDIAELIDIVTKLMKEYNEKISIVNNYYKTLYELQILQTLSITSTSSIPQ
ncbi:MAG: hypothetical protein RXR31_02695 [Thermoproteota archaeon]